MARSLSVLCIAASVGVVLVAVPTLALASPFGLSLYSQGDASASGATQTSPDDAAWLGVDLAQLAYATSLDLTPTGTSGSASSTFTASIVNGGLHDLAVASVSQTGSAYNGEDLFWFDTFTFQPGTYDVNVFLDGTNTLSTSSGHYLVADDADSLEFGENLSYGVPPAGGDAALLGGPVLATVGPGNSTEVQLVFSTETTLILGEELSLRPDIVCNESEFGPCVGESGSIVMDNSDTGYFTVTGITPGSGFTAASGLAYSGNPDTTSTAPEPGTFLLLVTGLGVAARRFATRTSR